MTDSPSATNRAPYYDGRGLPLGALSPKEFEEFVFTCLLCIGEVLGLRITGNPSGSGDGGFDVQGMVIASKRLACIQCKRQEQKLDTPLVAKELAKVAATAALEGSDVGEHRFICTGGIRTKLTKQLREMSRQELAVEAGNRLADASDSELASLRVRLENAGIDPRQVAESYVTGLDLLTAWDSLEFDAALSSRWSDVLQVAERYFRIATVVQEHPRASFDRAAYIEEHQNFKVAIEPRLVGSSLPDGISTTSAANLETQQTVSQRRIRMLHDLSELEPGELAILLGDGGVGKSTALALLRAETIRRYPDSTLPILISLANYVPGGLDRSIEQELGVVHGTWRTLPDKVLLLCDGVNECPSTNVAALLEELRPLLKRGRITCVLSTRGSTRHRNVVLPQAPVACVKIEVITPNAIRQIAEQKLHDGTSAAFVATYRSMADSSGAPHLWTPFAVLVALRLWQLNAALPPTLGMMLEALLQSRCARDAELPESLVDPAIILRLAGALAFQSLVIDQRLECPVLEAGKWIREAKKLCVNALGITDMAEAEVVALLTRHELLHLSASGHLSFGHQLLAGTLAAPLLASMWQEHTNSIGEPIADDAWVFAARMIPSEHKADFLSAAFNADLMLGARAARELPSSFHELAERLLIQSVDPEAPETIRIQGLFALAKLGSPGAIYKLRELVTDTHSAIHHAAKAALSAAGDLTYLQHLLPEVDRQTSVPFKVSGGEISIWEAAPFPIRLDLARQRLSECQPGEPVRESLLLIAYERDPNDAEVIETHLRAASDLTAWQPCLYALHKTSPIRAKEILDEALVEVVSPTNKATIMRVAAFIGIDIDLRSVFECAISELPDDNIDSHASFPLHQLITDVITKSTLPSNLIEVVENELPYSKGDRRTRLWQLAFGCQSSSIEEYAVSCIENRAADIGNAYSYFIMQPVLAQDRKQQLVEFCESWFEDEQRWYDFSTRRALELVGRIGFTKKAAECLSAMILRLTRVREAMETDSIASLAPEDAKLTKSTTPELLSIHLGMLAAPLIPAVAKARAFLTDDVLLSLLFFKTDSYGVGEDLHEMLSGLSDEAIDDVLNKVEDSWARLSCLIVICARGPTSIRVELLANALKESYAHPAAMNLLSKAIEACWSKVVCEMVIKVVAQIPVWPDSQSQFFWDFTRMVASRVESDDQSVIEEALLEAKTQFARRILALWREHALKGRIGLARLSLSTELYPIESTYIPYESPPVS